MGITTGGHPTHNLTIVRDRLISNNIGVSCLNDKTTQPQVSTRLSLGKCSRPANKFSFLFIRNKAIEARLDWSIDRPVFTRPRTKIFFQTQRIQCSRPKQADIVISSSTHKLVKQINLIFRPHPDFIPKITSKADTTSYSRHHSNIHFTNGHKIHRFIRDILVRTGLQHGARIRTGKCQTNETEIV